MRKSKYPEGLSEIKDFRGDNQIRIVRKGRITYKSTEGYKNKADMRQAATNDAIEILEEYITDLSDGQLFRIKNLLKIHQL